MEFLAMLVLAPLLSAQNIPVFQEDITAGSVSSTGPASMKRTDSPSSVFQNPKTSVSSSDEENRPLVEAYLYNGNVTFLSLANCSKAYQLPGRQRPAGELSLLLRPAVDAITNAANFLNMIFQANDLRDSSIKDDLEWYHALVRGLLESDPLIRRALLAFDTQPSALQPQLVLQAKHPSYKSQDILLQDLSSAWQDLHASPPALDASWYTALKSSAQTPPTLSKRILFNDLNTLETPKWGRGDSYVTNRDEVHWASAPFLECDKGQFLPDWLLTLSTSFYGLKPDLSPEFRGVIRIDVSLQSFDVDQCAQRKDWFSNTHRCNRTIMHCEPVHGRGFRLGQYACLCKEGYYSLPLGTQNARVGEDGTANTGEALSPPVPVCLPCWPGCKQCKDGAPCKVQGTRYLRLGVLAVQSLFMLLVLINMFVAYQFRQNKSIRASGLLLLETILFGSLLLYFPVFILYFKPSTFRCILLRWVRLMGFAMVYGTITLKMYRVLRVFLSRTAQRVPYMSSTHMLRLLGVIVLTVGWFLSAWTASVLQNRERNIPLLITSSTPEGKSFSLCDLDRWDYMMAVAELLFLCWGGSLHNSVRMIPSAFHEPYYMGISIHNELLLSSAFHITRFALPLLHPDWMLLLFFTHTHVTVSVTLGLLLIPKFLYMSQPIRKEMAAEVYEEEVDLQRSCSHFNSSFASAWNEHNMDSDDIRDELKKLYAQLEIHKTKKMSANNPHLPKKRSSHLGLGQSIMKHITRFPGSISRRCSREEVSQYSGGGSKPASCKKKILESGSIRSSEESFNKGVLLRCKSHSTYDRGQEHQLCTGDVKDSSLLNSSMRRKLTKKASESSEIKSEEAVPFVYKSASAHNLSADNQLLQPMPKKLQKSLSVMTSNMDGSALHPSMIYTADDGQHSSRLSQKESHPKHQLTISSQTLNAHLSELSNKAEVCFAENRSHKHVTYSIHPQNGQKSTERTESPLMQHNSPVEKLPCDFPLESIIWVQEDIMSKDQKKSEDRTGNTEGSDSGSEVARAQLSASGSAPHSPITILAQPEELRVLSLCGTSCNSTKVLKRTSKCSGKDKGIFSEEEQEANVEMLISKSEDSVGYSSSSLLNSMMDNVVILRKDNNGMYITVSDNLAQHTQQRNTANIPPRKLQEETATETTDTKERMQAELQNKARKQQSTYESVCPWETVNLQMIKRQTSIRTNICPWEVEEEPLFKDSKHISEGQGCTVQATMTNFKHENMVSKTDICPWEVSEAPQHSPKRQESIMADICPWETKETNPNSISISSDKQFNERLQEVKSTQKKEKMLTDICPWEEEDLENPGASQINDQRNNEVQEILQNRDRGKKETINVSVTCTSETTVKAEVCPWDIISQQTLQRPTEDIADICPWDIMSQQTLQRPTEDIADICPWDIMSQQALQRPTEDIADICPWDITSQQTLQRPTEDIADICPWDITSQQALQRPTEDIADICPWDIKSQQALQRPTEDIADICPWDITSQQALQRPSGDTADICPWDIMSQQTLQRPIGDIADICPWDVSDPDTKIQKSLQADICPLKNSENENASVTEKSRQKNGYSEICPWENHHEESQSNLKTVNAEVCPWDVSELQTTQRNPSNIAEICPWNLKDNDYTFKNTSESFTDGVKLTENKTQQENYENVCNRENKQLDKTIMQHSENEGTDHLEEVYSEKNPAVNGNTVDINSWESISTKPCLVKQTAIQTSSEEAEPVQTRTERHNYSTIIQPFKKNIESTSKTQDGNCADICPWEVMGTTPTVGKQNSSACVIATVEVIVTEPLGENEESQKPIICNKQVEGGQELIPPAPHDAICPWGVQEEKSLLENIISPDIPSGQGEEMGIDAESEAEVFYFPEDL